MSLHEYRESLKLDEHPRPPFYSLIMQAMRQADTPNEIMLRQCWPDVWDDLEARYHAPGGLLDGEQEPPG